MSEEKDNRDSERKIKKEMHWNEISMQLTLRKVPTQSVFCTPDQPNKETGFQESMHKVEINKVYVFKNKDVEEVNAYAICPIHNSQILVKLISRDTANTNTPASAP